MKRKDLQIYADKSLEKYQDEEFLRRLEAKADNNKRELKERERKSFNRRVVIPICAAAVVAVIVLVCVFVFVPTSGKGTDKAVDPPISLQTPVQPDNDSDVKHYCIENEAHINSTIAAINAATSSIDFEDVGTLWVKKAIDQVSQDDLYYLLLYTLNDELDLLKITVVINNDYLYLNAQEQYEKSIDVGDYELRYNESYNYSDELYYFHAKGEMMTDSEKIYFEYEGIWLEIESHFIQCVETVIR